jgi:excisionase family DNA binding protein
MLLSPKELAQAVGVSESSLKRWADDGKLSVNRTPGGHRKITLSEAVRFVRELRLPVVRPDILGIEGLTGRPIPPASDQAAGDELYALLERGDGSAVRGLVVGWFLTGQTVAMIADGPMRQAMARIGELWRHDSAGIFLEHRATGLTVQVINFLHALLPDHLVDTPLALGGAPPGDPYFLPSSVAACVLSECGWRTMNLGPDTPVDTFLAAAARERPRLVWLSISTTEPAITPDQVDQLARRLLLDGTKLVVGGRGAAGCLPAPMPGNACIVRSMAELSAFAHGTDRAPERRAESPGVS